MERKLRVLRVMLLVVGLWFMFSSGLPYLFPVRSIFAAFGVAWPKDPTFLRHAGAGWIGWGLVFLLAAKDPVRYITLVKLCLVLMGLDVLASILNMSFEGPEKLGWFLTMGYISGFVVLALMALLVPWRMRPTQEVR